MTDAGAFPDATVPAPSSLGAGSWELGGPNRRGVRVMGGVHGRPRRSSFLGRLARVVEEHREALIRLACWHGPECWAEDALHDAWVKVQRDRLIPAKPSPTDGEVLSWFIRIVRNRARNRRRYEKPRECEPIEEALDVAVMDSEDTDPLLEMLVVAAVDDLPPGQAGVAELRLHGYTFAETARMTNRSLGTVKKHWHRAKKKLRSRLPRRLLGG